MAVTHQARGPGQGGVKMGYSFTITPLTISIGVINPPNRVTTTYNSQYIREKMQNESFFLENEGMTGFERGRTCARVRIGAS